MFCENCGIQTDPNSQFCPNCGAKIDARLTEARTARPTGASYRESKPTKKLQTILVLSIPAALIALIVVWFLTGVMGTRREGFEKFLPENTAYYVEVHDPIELLVDFQQSALFKRLTASPEWKEWEKDNSDLRDWRNILARLAAVRNVVGPVGIASIPFFSEAGALIFGRIERDYIGATRVNLEQFLDSQKVKYRKNQNAGRIKYDLETPPNSSFLLTDFGIIAGDSPAIDKYIEWLETSRKSNLENSENFKKINRGKSGAYARAQIYLDSSSFLNSLSQRAGPTGIIANSPSWVAKGEISFTDGIHLSSSFSFSQQSSVTKNILQAVQKPISNSSLKYLPKDVVAFTTINLMAIWEVAKDEVRRQGAGGRHAEVENLLQTLTGEAVFIGYEGPINNKWDGGIVGVEQKTPAAFIKALEELVPELKTARQTERYGQHDIACYPLFFGTPLCLANVDNFVFASPNKQALYKVLDVKDGKAAGFQQTINANAKLNRLFAGNRHGVIYVDLKDITRNIPFTLWGSPKEIAIKDKIANASSPFYLAGAADISGDILNAEANLVFNVSEFETLFTSLAEESFRSYRARSREASIAGLPVRQGYVNDFAGVISPLHQSKIAEIAKTLEHNTSAQLVVVTVASTKPESIETYAARLGNVWGLGQKGKDNGILLLVAIEDRRVRIEVGSVFERSLPDALLKKIIDAKILPHFRNGDYSKGTQAGVEALYDRLSHTGTITQQQTTGRSAIDRPVFTPLGGLDLAGYCRSRGYEGANLSKPQIGDNAAYDNWRCTSSGVSNPPDLTEACKWQYRINNAQARPANTNDAYTWNCFAN